MRVLTVLLVIVLSACANDATGPSTGAITVTGGVFDFKTRAPIAGAVIDFRTDVQTPFLTAQADANGRYAIELPRRGLYLAAVNSGPFGQMRAEGRDYRGDLLVDTGTCIARYGTVTDEESGKPIAGAKLTLGGVAMSGNDGWYTIDMGCPEPVLGGGTTMMTVERSGYEPRQQVVGRGVQRVQRLDVALKKKE